MQGEDDARTERGRNNNGYDGKRGGGEMSHSVGVLQDMHKGSMVQGPGEAREQAEEDEVEHGEAGPRAYLLTSQAQAAAAPPAQRQLKSARKAMLPLKINAFLVAGALAVVAAILVCILHKLRSIFYAGAPYVLPRFWEARNAHFRKETTDNDAKSLTAALRSHHLMLIRRNGHAYKLLGETGNVYDVVMGVAPTCTCPAFVYRDAAKVQRAHCKHVGWLLLRVYKVPASHYLARQQGYAAWEWEYIAAHCAEAGAKHAPNGVIEALGLANVRNLSEHTECAICYEELGKDKLLRCAAQCRRPFHEACVLAYNKSVAADGVAPVCACCRAPWVSSIDVSLVETKVATYQHVTHPLGVLKRASSVKKK